MNFKKQYAALGIPDCPVDAFKPEGKKLKLHGGGGGGQPSNTSTTTVPEYLQTPYTNLITAAQSQIYNFDNNGQITGVKPYQPYGGQLTAGQTGLQAEAAQGAGNLTTSPNFGQASGLAGLAGSRALNAGNNFAPGTFQGGTWTPDAANQYMSPYMQGVVDVNKRQALRDAAIQGTQRAAKFSQAGAFGGSRQAISDAEASRNLNQQLQDIQSKGMQDAYTTGLQAYQSDAARALQAQQAGEQSRQFGANLGIQGSQAATQAAQTLGQLGATQGQQQQDILKLQNQLGTQQQQTAQAAIDAQMNQWANAQNYGYRQLGFLSDLLHGVPGSSTSIYQAAPSSASQLAGAGLAGLGLYNSLK